jgi:hypothetical protein
VVSTPRAVQPAGHACCSCLVSCTAPDHLRVLHHLCVLHCP